MKLNPPEIIRAYIDSINSVPLVNVNGTRWFSITDEEKRALMQYRDDLDRIPRETWDALPVGDKWKLSCAWHDADRIIRNSIVK
jgi:hypothetical protein